MSLNRLFARPVRRAALALCAAAVLTACGGGDRAEPFTPGRIFAFGDELSVLDDSASAGNAQKYSLNGFNATTTTQLDCTVYPIWIQTLANSFAMGFKECPGAYAGKLTAFTRAKKGAKVADLVAQVDAYVGASQPVSNDLTTMLAGSNDVLEVYASWKAGTLDETGAVAEMKKRAELLAAQVNRVVQLGPPVLVATLPWLSVSPFAVSEGGNAPAMLEKLVTAFNDALVSGGQGEGASKGLASYGLTGKDYGLIQTGTSYIKGIAENTSDSVRAYNTTPLCAEPYVGDRLKECTTSTLNTGASGNESNWVWADSTRPGYVFQLQLGSRAATMAGPRGLPF